MRRIPSSCAAYHVTAENKAGAQMGPRDRDERDEHARILSVMNRAIKTGNSRLPDLSQLIPSYFRLFPERETARCETAARQRDTLWY